MSEIFNLKQLSENLPLVGTAVVLLFLFVKSIINRAGYRHKNHDIDAMIRKSKLRFQSDYGSQKNEKQGPTIKEQLKDLDDPTIKEMLSAMEWGDKFSFPLLTIPFSRVSDRTLYHYKRVLMLQTPITFKDSQGFFDYVENQINRYYLDNPIEDFIDDDFLTAVKLLGVLQDDSPEKIKKRYHSLSKKYHPDTFSESSLNDLQIENLNKNYKLIQKAYTILNEKEKA